MIAGLLLLAAAVLRLAWLGRASYTIDECALLQITLSYHSFLDLIRSEFERFTFLHRLPMTMLCLRAMASLALGAAPVPEWLTRLPMALAGIGAVAAMFGAGILDRRAGWWAAFLATISFFGVFYSREAYDYGLLILFSTTTLFSGLNLFRSLLSRTVPSNKLAVLYIASAALLLQSHLTGLLFLAPQTLLLGFFLIVRHRGYLRQHPTRAARWLLVLGAPYVFFLPFLFKLLSSGFTVTESETARRFSLAVFPSLWGRMGWGEGLLPLAAFTFFWLAGCLFGISRKDSTLRNLYLLVILHLLLYFALQSWMLRISRFEIRYYSPLFPCLLVITATGMVAVEDFCRQRLGRRAAMGFRSLAVLALVVWSAPSLWQICRLECRGFANYKGIARWINTRVPAGGIYSFLNVYELRGVPGMYPTPGRVATSVAYWSSKEEHLRARPVERARYLFTQYPTMYFIEIAPSDLLCPDIAEDFIPRDELFLRHVWLEDPAYDFLVRWRTHPIGETQYNVTNQHKVLISYNLPEDIPQLARRQGRNVYHYYGRGWQYTADQRLTDWMLATGHAVLALGNISTQALTVSLSLTAVGVPRGCVLSIRRSGDVLIKEKAIAPNLTTLSLPALVLPPGETSLEFLVTPPQNQSRAAILVRALRLTTRYQDGSG